MYLSRLQLSQIFLSASFLLTMLAIVSLMWGPIAVGIFCLVLAHTGAAMGCYVYAEVKGYPPILGIPIGIGLGVAGAVILVILPDESKRDVFESERRVGRNAIENARRDKGYEVLEDEGD